MDNAPELVKLSMELEKAGVRIERIAAYTPSQNGVAERLNCTLITRARTLLAAAELPERLWGEAVYAANHLRNLTPQENGASPEQRWTGQKPKISHLRVFGCVAYTHIMLGRQLDDLDEVDSHYSLALLRKHFREIFHAQFRPIINLGHNDTVQALRKRYENLLDDKGDGGRARRQRFDRLRLIGLEDFEKYGELPRFGMHDSMTKTLRDIMKSSNEKPFVVFLSYRWVGRDSDPKSVNPDDAQGTQYNRMVLAIDEVLERHNEVQCENVYIWLDCACIDQEDLEPGRRERGINSLPIFVAQCDAMISLVDKSYLTRAWCAVEILIMQTLRETSNQHEWWEHQLHDPDNDSLNGLIDRGRIQKVEPSRMDLTHESDRRHIDFLERQSMLLGEAASGN